MMRVSWYKKGLVVGIIFILMLVSVPIYVGGESYSNEYSNTTKSTLTASAEDELDVIFSGLKEKIKNVDKKEDCNLIFKEAIIKLNECDLLGGISVDDAYKLVSSSANSDNSYSVYGESSKTYFLERTGVYFYELSKKYGSFFSLFCDIIWHRFLFANINPPVHIDSWIIFGSLHYVRYYLYDAYPAEGYINIVSSEGEIEYNSFYGHLEFIDILDIQDPMGGHNFYCIGIKGFKGILIGDYYFGTAKEVNISTDIPDPYDI
jgi:hypothetical protein